VTSQTSEFYYNSFKLLNEYKWVTSNPDFGKAFEEIIQNLATRKGMAKSSKQVAVSEGDSRQFSENQKTAVSIRALLNNNIKCPICGGLLDLSQGTQFDHIIEYGKGGKTTEANARPTHPFCNNNRIAIEAIKFRSQLFKFPEFINQPLTQTREQQMAMAFDFNDPYSDS